MIDQFDVMAGQGDDFFLNEDRMKEFATGDQRNWSLRNDRIFRHRRMFELKKPAGTKVKPGERLYVTNDAKLIIRKFASMIANHPPQIVVPYRDPMVSRQAQRCSDFLRYYREEEALRFAQGPNGDRSYVEAETLVRDGMLVDITVCNPSDDDFPWISSLPDVATVYPTYAGDQRLRTTIVYQSTLGDARMMASTVGITLEDVLEDMADRKDDDSVRIVKVFTGNKHQGYEMGVMVNDKLMLLKGMDYDPVTIQYAAGRNYVVPEEMNLDGSRPGLSGVVANENIGVGLLDVLEEPLKEKNRDYSMLKAMLDREANPPKVLFTNDEGKADQLSLDAGSNMIFWQDDKFQLVNTNPDFSKFQAALQIAQQGIERGSVPPALYGEGNANSGVQDYMLMGNARDAVYPFVKAMERFYRQKYRKVLELYREYGINPVPMVGMGQAPQPGDPGIVLAGQPFTVDDVAALGHVEVMVQYSEITPQNEATKANMAVTLTREKILDLESARRMLPAPFSDSPEAINQKVLQDLTLMNPQMTQILSLAAALKSPDPLVQHLASLMIPNLMTQVNQAAATPPPPPGGQQGPGGPPPAQGPQAPNGPPPPNNQMHPAANPPQLGQQAGAPPGQPHAGGPTPPPGV